jgi:glyoxylase-like metal-dependent hydrolase (beta-lactamase superfamily II)
MTSRDTLHVKRYYLNCLAQASYLVYSEESKLAVIIDPRRDTAVYTQDAASLGLTIKAVLLTHVHADFVSGHEELRRSIGATIFAGALTGLAVPHYPVTDGDTLSLSDRLSVRALCTPGHTPGCVTWVATDGGTATKAFTGDTLFIGSVGRPDLVGSVQLGGGAINNSADMSRMMFHSLTTKIMSLPDNCEVWPAHGAGSPCGKNLSGKNQPFLLLLSLFALN